MNGLKFGIVVFPGTNCDTDCYWALSFLNQDVEYVWHQDTHLSDFDCLVLPGGFSYGDYLRTGAIARFSPVMQAVSKYAQDGGLVIGICNGFQILLEAGLLPGAMRRNTSLKFVCKNVSLKVENNNTVFSRGFKLGDIVNIPIAHNEGNYYVDDKALESLIDNEQVILRYCDADGDTSTVHNPNGSVFNIAGVCNEQKNVFGLMPHPERAMESLLGSADGRIMFESIVK